MTLDHWLGQATAGLPPEVAGRVRAEYAAHIAESDLPETDAVAALGSPHKVRRALGRTYLSGERLETLREGAAVTVVTALIWGMPFLLGLGIALIYADAPAFPWWHLAAPALTVLLTAVVWGLTRRAPAERRALWRVGWGGVGVPFMLWLGNALELWRGEDVLLPWFIPLMGLGLLLSLLWTALEDRRLRRTLALKEVRP